ncbi:MAG: tail-specific protease [Gammaproteobacteria bacterium]|nr:MAG: tail-specific protease [Gammaproteobacteria bacterium]
MASALRNSFLSFCLVLALPALALKNGDNANFETLKPEDTHARTSINVIEQLTRHHYVRQRLDDDLSSQILDRYLEMLDPQRSYFLASDIESFEGYRYVLDDALRKGDLEPAFKIFNRYQQRLRDRLEFTLGLIADGLEDLDFSTDDSIETDRSESPWLVDEAAMDDLWTRRLKANVLSMRLNDRDFDAIRESLERRYSNRLSRSAQTNSEDAFQLYMNAVATSFDPHTQYFSPRTSENFNINMSLSLEGIGAVLRSEDEFTTVVRLVPAGPADKSSLLNPSDRIVGVGQEDDDIVDVIGWRLDDVVDLIRGPAGSKVRLDVVPAGSGPGAQPHQISLVREAVKLEEQSAQRRVLNVERNGREHKIGVIEIPTFYIDFKALQAGDPEYKSTTRDVRRLIEELEAEGVEGIVVDLRNNGGGSLQEASALTGLFIKAGPTVQVRSASGRVDLFNDEGGDVAWDGPLAVLVNRLSASASEIFAGAIQDYQRGLVLGGQTFGKGTVQTLIPLNRGQLKLTQAKFYRVSGQSTQHQGIIPDIEFPELFDQEKIGESTLSDALPWDVIRPTRFRREQSLAPMISMLETRHQSRVEQDPEFAYLNELVRRNREQAARTTLSLNEAQRRQEKADEEAWRVDLENRRRLASGKQPIEDMEQLRQLSAAGEASGAVPGGPPPLSSLDEDGMPAEGEAADDESGQIAARDTDEVDGLLQETGKILIDFVTLRQSVAELDDASARRSN